MIDTSPEILQKQKEVFARKSRADGFMIGVDAINFGRKIVESSIRHRHPDISETELKIRVFKRLYSHIFEPKELKKISQAMEYYLQNKA